MRAWPTGGGMCVTEWSLLSPCGSHYLTFLVSAPTPPRHRRAALDTLSSQKTELTAALTTAQVQLKAATPEGFAAEAAELRRKAEAAQQEAAAARADAAAAASRAADAQRRETEAAGHMREAARCMEEAHAARAAGLGREQQLAAQVKALQQQLAGKLPAGDPARLAQVGDESGACCGGQGRIPQHSSSPALQFKPCACAIPPPYRSEPTSCPPPTPPCSRSARR